VKGSEQSRQWTETGACGRRRAESGPTTSIEKEGREKERRVWSSHLIVESSLVNIELSTRNLESSNLDPALSAVAPSGPLHRRCTAGLGRPELALAWISHASIDPRRRRPPPGDAPPMARPQLRGRSLCTWPHVCLASRVGDSHEGPLNNQGKPAYIRKKQTQTNLKTHARQTRGPPNNRPSHPRAELRFARGVRRRTGTTSPRSRAGRPLG
jgi:hypothetical protein